MGGDRPQAPPPWARCDGRRRARRPRRVGRRRDQDPAHRAVRDHRPELLLGLADRPVRRHGGRRQRPARARTGDGGRRPATTRPTVSCWRWRRQRFWPRSRCCARRTCSPRPSTSGRSAAGSPDRCSTSSAPASTSSILPDPCWSTSAPSATSATRCSPNCSGAASTSCSLQDPPTSPDSGTTAATTARRHIC